MLKRFCWHLQAWLTSSCCALLLMAVTMPAVGQTLPPPPRAGASAAVWELHLEIIVNQRSTQRIEQVTQRDGELFIKREVLLEIGLPSEHLNHQDHTNLSQLNGLEASYHSPSQRLYIEVPPDWLPHQFHTNTRQNDTLTLHTSPGALLNYDAYISDTQHSATLASLGHEARLFGAAGTLSTSGIYREIVTGESGLTEGYRRFDTRWEYADQERMIQYAAGDVITRPLGWTNAVRLGGIQVSRNFALRPDLITHPLPEFSGEAAVPTTLDLFIDGSRQSSMELAPGPFTVTNMPMVTGAGTAMIVTTDSQGRRVSTSLPFYVSSELLQPGLSSFSISTGALRRNFGQRDFDYGGAAATGSYRRGINNHFTIELQTEASEDLTTVGAGGTFGLWRLGTLETAYRQSHSEGVTGEAYTAGYRYRSRRFNMGLRHQIEQADFTDLSRSIHSASSEKTQREVTQLTAGLSLGQMGSLAGGYFDIKTGDDSRTRLFNLSYNRPLWERMHLSLSANREVGGSWNTLAQITLPLNSRPGTLSTSMQRNSDGEIRTRTQYAHNPPLQGGWGWNLAYEHRDTDSDYRQAEVAWRGVSTELRGGIFGTGNDDVRFANARGSLVRMDNQWFATNYIRDGFVVVSTDGQADIPVRYENQLVGHTRDSGHLLVPWARAYYAGKYEIDPLILPANLSAPKIEQRIAVNAGSGYLLRFPVERIVAATLEIVDSQGEPLPLGSQIIVDSGATSLVGWDGLTYLEGLESDNRLQVTLPNGSKCALTLSIDTHINDVQQLGPQSCL
ncbi:fimbria/pilus outer membrane usher protein [Vreelandella nigrificans]|uniref:Fimbrial assembly protein n=1 Tax=Vreelandella nigrificans TaxID=2042704 RepID=A0A2A4HHN3_9GAMM|nr:fimbria/pilus outer membrane usher protein [Halomonas nigrificans]PCF93859.1 fimbrial assembly protein [Halomonas nigrificans]